MKATLKPLLLLTLLSIPQAFAASRVDTFTSPFVVGVDQADLGMPRMWDFPGVRRTAQYESLHLPQAPLFHPLDPGGAFREGCRGPWVTFNLKLPSDYLEALPASMQKKILDLNIAHQKVEVFWVVQNLPWAQSPLLFRPHYWLDPAAPRTGPYAGLAHAIRVGLFETNGELHFHGHTATDFFAANVQVQSQDHGPVLSTSTPESLSVDGLDAAKSRSFWTLTQSGDRVAATLHVLLNDSDQMAMAEIAGKVHNLRELVKALDGEGSPFHGKSISEKLKQLTRPILQVTALPAQAGGRCL